MIITNLNNKLVDIANESDLMGNTIKEEDEVEKVLRSLPESCDGKVTAIKES